MQPNVVIFMIFILILITDYVWLSTKAPMYQATVHQVQKTPMNVRYMGGLVAYIFVILGLILFTFPMIRANCVKSPNCANISNVLKNALIYGGGLGLVIYGVFNSTNYAIFDKYSISTAIQDTAWGVFLFTFVSVVYQVFVTHRDTIVR